MKNWAEIDQYGRVKVICEFADNFTPQISKPMFYVDLTGLDPQPEVGWYWNSVSQELQESMPDNVYDTYYIKFNTQRTALFTESDWVRDRHSDRLNIVVTDNTNWDAWQSSWDLWLIYWQTLRNMPEQGGFDPANPEWPTKPE